MVQKGQGCGHKKLDLGSLMGDPASVQNVRKRIQSEETDQNNGSHLMAFKRPGSLRIAHSRRWEDIELGEIDETSDL